MIVSVCVASATFCSRLEKQALRSIGLDSAAAEHFRTVADQAESSSVQNNEKTAQSAESREAVLKPILASRGLSIHDWATKAGVDFHTANNYLKGKTDHPYPGTLKKLADALDIEVAKLPK